MKITHNKVGQNLNVRDNAPADKSDKAGKAGAVSSANAKDVKDVKAKGVESTPGADATRVNLSTRAQEIKRAKEIAMATPDINEEKVARLQKLIDAGEYKTDAKAIASKMVDEHSTWE